MYSAKVTTDCTVTSPLQVGVPKPRFTNTCSVTTWRIIRGRAKLLVWPQGLPDSVDTWLIIRDRAGHMAYYKRPSWPHGL